MNFRRQMIFSDNIFNGDTNKQVHNQADSTARLPVNALSIVVASF